MRNHSLSCPTKRRTAVCPRREWSPRERRDIDLAKEEAKGREPGGSNQDHQTNITLSTIWLVAQCPRRESNSDLRFRKPPFYPLNYEDRVISDFRSLIADFKCRTRVTDILLWKRRTTAAVGNGNPALLSTLGNYIASICDARF